MIEVLTDDEIKEIEADGAYGTRQLIVEIEELKQQNSFLEEENKLIKSILEVNKIKY